MRNVVVIGGQSTSASQAVDVRSVGRSENRVLAVVFHPQPDDVDVVGHRPRQFAARSSCRMATGYAIAAVNRFDTTTTISPAEPAIRLLRSFMQLLAFRPSLVEFRPHIRGLTFHRGGDRTGGQGHATEQLVNRRLRFHPRPAAVAADANSPRGSYLAVGRRNSSGTCGGDTIGPFAVDMACRQYRGKHQGDQPARKQRQSPGCRPPGFESPSVVIALAVARPITVTCAGHGHGARCWR
jgi:hypothetical protein